VSQAILKVDIAVIGAGSGGLSVASGAAQLGLKVALFERAEMGGDCLNYGCVPSKALLAAAKAAHQMRSSAHLGVTAAGVNVDFPTVMAHVHGAIAAIAPHDSQARFEGLGVRVIREQARFVGERRIASRSVTVEAKRIAIAAGSRPAIPPVPGLEALPYLTNETIFGLTELPRRLLILGGGPIGVELGQAFRRLGSEVAVVARGEILSREDPEAAALVARQLEAEGIELLPNHRVVEAAAGPALTVEGKNGRRTLEGSHLLVAAGRRPSLEGLDLDKAGIAHDEKGVCTDRKLRSSNRRVYAVGDAAGREQYTHLAGAHAGLFIRNAIFRLPVNADTLVVPRVTYADPELAAVGLSEAEARAQHGEKVRVERFDLCSNDRATAEGDRRGFGKLIAGPDGRILGAVIVGTGAGDIVSQWVLAMSAGLKLSKLTGMIAPYPTRSELPKRLAGQFYTPKLFSSRTRWLVSLLNRLP
jgi:pyruvate/2-oxoglutarate dehydrogenase complex dihydrolipoamide dehydrogenase (E3) component